MACRKGKAHSIASAIGFPAFSMFCGDARWVSPAGHSPKCEFIRISANSAQKELFDRTGRQYYVVKLITQS